ncbi:hypothetical protein ACWD3J_44375 [Streptomyces sp. NPDC002755]|uniref:hypothetical protein n=1 Tax=Streptomyces sp. NPDC002884 TaxID=3154544 RepID=UPI00332BD688
MVVDSGGSGAELWVYYRPSAARHHRHHRLRRLRWMGASHRGKLDAAACFDGEASHLQDWANRYAHSWKAMRGGGPVHMGRFLRRLARLEAGLTDCAYYAKPGVLAGIVEKAGLPYEGLSEDVAYAIGMTPRRPSDAAEHPGTRLCTLCGAGQELTPLLRGFDHITDSAPDDS